MPTFSFRVPGNLSGRADDKADISGVRWEDMSHMTTPTDNPESQVSNVLEGAD